MAYSILTRCLAQSLRSSFPLGHVRERKSKVEQLRKGTLDVRPRTASDMMLVYLPVIPRFFSLLCDGFARGSTPWRPYAWLQGGGRLKCPLTDGKPNSPFLFLRLSSNECRSLLYIPVRNYAAAATLGIISTRGRTSPIKAVLCSRLETYILQ